MAELLDALLDISQLDSGTATPSKKNFSQQLLLDHIVANNEPTANGKGLAFHFEISPYVIYSAPNLLEWIVESFVSNAICYTAAGHIEVSSVS
jgi:signal transduction histidine kinase